MFCRLLLIAMANLLLVGWLEARADAAIITDFQETENVVEYSYSPDTDHPFSPLQTEDGNGCDTPLPVSNAFSHSHLTALVVDCVEFRLLNLVVPGIVSSSNKVANPIQEDLLRPPK